MTERDQEPRRVQDGREDAAETRLQVDPMLRPGRTPWAWPITIALAVLAIAIVLFATNQEDNEVVETEPPTATTGAAPPETTPDSSRGMADAPPTKPDATGTPVDQDKTGENQ